jgi:hypothetical protein
MAVAIPPGPIHQTAAQNLQAAYKRTTPERIYYDALEEVRGQAIDDDDTKLLQKLLLVRNEVTLKAFLENDVKNGPKIGPQARWRFDRRLAKLSQKSKRALELAEKIASIGSWTALSAVVKAGLMNAKTLPSRHQSLD